MSAQNRRITILLFLVGWFAATECLIFAQGGKLPAPRPSSSPTADSGLGSLRGRIVLPDGSFVNESVKITLGSMRGTESPAYTDTQGQFDFPNLSPGSYKLEVEADKQQFDTVIATAEVYRGLSSVVTIFLKKRNSANKSRLVGKTVSVGEFGNDIPAKARKEFDEASKDAKENKVNEAIVHLKKAIAIYPDYVMAHNDLGSHLLGLGKLNEATEELNKAIAIDPNAFNPQLNLGIVLVQQHKFTDATEILKKAISLQSAAPAARFYAGIAYIGLNDLDAAERELKSAYDLGGHTYALALFHLGQLYMSKGERRLALTSFEAFLKEEPNAPSATQVRRLISMLK